MFYTDSLPGRVAKADLAQYRNSSQALRVHPGNARQYAMAADYPGVVVLPRADDQGGSSAWDPNRPPHQRAVVSLEGRNLLLDVGDVTPALATQAVQYSQSVDVSHCESRREARQVQAEAYMRYLQRAGTARITFDSWRELEAVAGIAPGVAAAPPLPPAADPPPLPPPPLPPPPLPPPPLPPPPPRASAVKRAEFSRATGSGSRATGDLMGAFRQAAAPAIAGIAGGDDAVGPPLVCVRFDVPLGDQTVELQMDFHEWHMASGGNAILFGYDERYRGGHRLNFSRAATQPFACHVAGTDTLYLVESPDVEFRIGHRAYSLYVIHQALPLATLAEGG